MTDSSIRPVRPDDATAIPAIHAPIVAPLAHPFQRVPPGDGEPAPPRPCTPERVP